MPDRPYAAGQGVPRTYAPPVRDLAREAGYVCPHCKGRLSRTVGGSEKLRPSRDHILPRVRGGMTYIHGDVRNWRLLCSSCNSFTAMCGHCPGARATVETVAAARGVDRVILASLLGLGKIAAAADMAFQGVVPKRSQWDGEIPCAPAATLADVWPKAAAEVGRG